MEIQWIGINLLSRKLYAQPPTHSLNNVHQIEPRRSMDNAAKLKAVSHLQAKIQKTREKIKVEQNNKET